MTAEHSMVPETEHVIAHPHWSVLIRPYPRLKERVEVSRCWEIVQRCTVSARGWPYPFFASDGTTRVSPDYVQASYDKGQYKEFWRYYRSGQFLHLMAVEEAISAGYRQSLAKIASDRWLKDDPGGVPGFIDVINVIYTLSEVVAFMCNLAQQPEASHSLGLRLNLNRAKGYVLSVSGVEYGWHRDHRIAEDSMKGQFEFVVDDLVADRIGQAIRVCAWFFDGCGAPLKPEVLSQHIRRLLR